MPIVSLAIYGMIAAVGVAGLWWAVPALSREIASHAVLAALFPMLCAAVFGVVAFAGLRGLVQAIRGGDTPRAGILADGPPNADWEAAVMVNLFALPVGIGAAWAVFNLDDKFVIAVAAVLGATFVAMGASLVLQAIGRSRQWWRYGQAVARLDPPRPVTGTRLTVTLAFDRGVPVGTRVRVGLRCQTRRYGSGFWRPDWEAQVDARTVAIAGGVQSQAQFDIPSDLPSTLRSRMVRHEWRLTASSKSLELPLEREFVLDVAKGGSSPALSPLQAPAPAQDTFAPGVAARFASGEVQADASGIRIARRRFFGSGVETIAAREIAAVFPAVWFARMTATGRWTSSYAVLAGLESGRVVRLFAGIGEASQAADLAQRCGRAVGLDASCIGAIERAHVNLQRFKRDRLGTAARDDVKLAKT